MDGKEIRQIYPNEIERFPEENHPQRQQNGLVLRQNYGVFPRQINLEIRHTNATLGLGEVAQIRQQHNVNAVYQNCEIKGVLSLGLPEKFMPKNFSGTSQRKPPISATSEAICHYYETLNPKYANIVTINRQKVRHEWFGLAAAGKIITGTQNQMQTENSPLYTAYRICGRKRRNLHHEWGKTS